jgi:hypothetical protein
MANFEKIAALRDHLVWLRSENLERKFNMEHWLTYNGQGACTVRHLKDKCPEDTIVSHRECGTVACLAGHIALMEGVPEHAYVEVFASDILGLNSLTREDYFMFQGDWSTKPIDEITLDDAIEYLDKVLSEKCVRVYL